MQSLSNQVKQRDGYRCRLCHSPKQIEAHHLFGKQRFPKLEYNINNLITLCKNVILGSIGIAQAGLIQEPIFYCF